MMGPTEGEDTTTRTQGGGVEGNPKGAPEAQQQQQQKRTLLRQDDDDSASGSEGDEGSKTSGGDLKAEEGGGGGEVPHHRREKRLAMNRESARARRKRKKMLLDTLEQQVAELAERNQRLQSTVDSLQGKVRTLESELSGARSTIAMLNSQQPAAAASMASAAGVGMGSPAVGMGGSGRNDAGVVGVGQGGQESLYRLFPSAAPARLVPDSVQAQFYAEEALLRRNAALEFRAYAAGRESAALEAYRQQFAAASTPGIPVSAMQTAVRAPIASPR